MYILQSVAKSEKNDKKENEDAIYTNDRLGLYIIADGMDGKNGKEASAFCTNFLSEKIKKRKRFHSLTPETIENFVRECNDNLFSMCKKNRQKGEYGTTLDLVWFDHNTFYVFHIGNSRVYGLTKKKNLEQLTEDETVGNEKLKQGMLNKYQLKVNRFNKGLPLYQPIYEQLTNGLGIETLKNIHVNSYPVEAYGIILMTTDGITDLVLDEEIDDILKNHDLENATNAIMKKVKDPEGIVGFNLKHNHYKLNSLLENLHNSRIENKEFSKLLSALERVQYSYDCAETIRAFCKKYPSINELFRNEIKSEIQKDNASIILIQQTEVQYGIKRFFGR